LHEEASINSGLVESDQLVALSSKPLKLG